MILCLKPFLKSCLLTILNFVSLIQGRHGWQGPQGALPNFWVSVRSYKKQLVKKIWGRILGLA